MFSTMFSTIFFTLLLILGLIPLALAASEIHFYNRCPYDVYFWTVAPSGKLPATDADRHLVPGDGGHVSHAMVNTEALGGGISLKIRDLPYYEVAPAGIIQMEYHLEPSGHVLWYDLSVSDCDSEVGPEDPMYCRKFENNTSVEESLLIVVLFFWACSTHTWKCEDDGSQQCSSRLSTSGVS